VMAILWVRSGEVMVFSTISGCSDAAWAMTSLPVVASPITCMSGTDSRTTEAIWTWNEKDKQRREDRADGTDQQQLAIET